MISKMRKSNEKEDDNVPDVSSSSRMLIVVSIARGAG